MKITKFNVGAIFMAYASAYVANSYINEALGAVRKSTLYRQRVKLAEKNVRAELQKVDREDKQLLAALFKGDDGASIMLKLDEGLEHNRERIKDAVRKECPGDPNADVWAAIVLAEATSEISVQLNDITARRQDRRKVLQYKLQAVSDAARCPERVYRDLTVRSIGDQLAKQWINYDWIADIITQQTREQNEKQDISATD